MVLVAKIKEIHYDMFLLPDGHTYKNVGLSISELPQDLRLLITYVKSVKKHPPDRFND